MRLIDILRILHSESCETAAWFQKITTLRDSIACGPPRS